MKIPGNLLRAFWVFAITFPLATAGSVFAQERSLDDVTKLFQPETYVSSMGTRLLYRQLDPPQIADNAKYPLVIFLHGAGERGDDNQLQLKHAMSDFSSERIAGEFPAFVIAPQCPLGKRWVEVDWTLPEHAMPEKPSESMAALIELIEKKIANPNVDSKRIYATGLSMGGFGVWDLIMRKPAWFAAAMPVCGGADSTVAQVEKIKHIPIRMVHGNADGVVMVKRSRDMVRVLESSGAKPVYVELDGVGHNSWTAAYSDIEAYRWLFAQRRP